MFDGFYNLIAQHIFGQNPSNGIYANDYLNTTLELFNNPMPIGDYLSFLIAIVVMIIIWILCCLMVYKAIKMIGRLFVRF